MDIWDEACSLKMRAVLRWRRNTKEVEARNPNYMPYAYEYAFPRSWIVLWVAKRYTRMILNRLKGKTYLFIQLNLKDPYPSYSCHSDISRFTENQMGQKENNYLKGNNYRVQDTDYCIQRLEDDLYIIFLKTLPSLSLPAYRTFRSLLKEIENTHARERH